MGIENYFSDTIEIEEIDKSEVNRSKNHQTDTPVYKFNEILKSVREVSQNISSLENQMSVVEKFKKELEKFSNEYDLEQGHFDIDTSGRDLLVKQDGAEHDILPMHFEKGAYFSSPHFDHELGYDAEQLPKIHIGKYTRFGIGASVNAGNNIDIGDYVWLAPGSVLLRQEHSAYGQPSIGARTMAMTNQPAIKVSDYAWVGRDAIVGWNCGYIGKASIVGARSFINKWVGDYTIVGDHSKILDYLPYKAYLFDKYLPDIEEVLKISDWEAVNNDWQEEFNNNLEQQSLFDSVKMILDLEKEKLTNKDSVLVFGADKNMSLDDLFFTKVDFLVDQKSDVTPYVLEAAKRAKFMKLRVKRYGDGESLPLPDATHSNIKPNNGYKLVVFFDADEFASMSIQELDRISAEKYHVIVPDDVASSGSINDNFKILSSVSDSTSSFSLMQRNN